VEILRDGASAQYGSDAIAGVINLILKKSVNKVSGSIGFSGYHDPKFNTAYADDLRTQYISDKKIDGKSFSGNINFGVPLGKKGGFFNATLEGLTSEKTFRQALDTSNYHTNDDAMFINIYRRAHGDASLDALGSFINMEVPTRGNTTFYSFGGINYKSSDAYAFTRNFSAKPERFPTDGMGNLIFVPSIMKVTNDGETFFNPHIQTRIHDYAATAGLKGRMASNWNWDFSNTFGRNRVHFFGDKTFNASQGAAQTHFDDGGFSFNQNTVNLNLSKEVSTRINIGAGAEYRHENYRIFSGEAASYTNYSSGNKATGSQGFPGYQPNDVVDANRSVWGAYGDLEFDATPEWLLDWAVRLEDYSDFGFTHNYKFATRYKASKNINLRGSVSTGFRAPSLQQINFSSTFTTVQAGTIAEVKIAPNYSALAKAAGIPNLKQERSLNAGIGFTWKANAFLNITIDGYLTKIKDRVVLSGQFDGSDPNLDAGLRAQMATVNVALAQFFANAVNTSNKGIDIVVEYNRTFGNNKFRGLFTGNLQSMDITRINVPAKLSGSNFLRQTFLSDREQKFILASAPNTKFAFNLEYSLKKLGLGARATYFGKVVLLGYGQDGLGINPTVPLDNGTGDVPDRYNYRGKFVTDLNLNYPLSKKFTVYLGVDNILNTHPDFGVVKGAKDWAYNNETGGPWDAVQMGNNGRRAFLRLAFNF
jgi:iron complex outermembrane receptor protein